MEKNPLKYQFLSFFYNIGPNLVQILPQRPHPFYFFWLISNEYVKGFNYINNLSCNPVVLKKRW